MIFDKYKQYFTNYNKAITEAKGNIPSGDYFIFDCLSDDEFYECEEYEEYGSYEKYVDYKTTEILNEYVYNSVEPVFDKVIKDKQIDMFRFIAVKDKPEDFLNKINRNKLGIFWADSLEGAYNFGYENIDRENKQVYVFHAVCSLENFDFDKTLIHRSIYAEEDEINPKADSIVILKNILWYDGNKKDLNFKKISKTIWSGNLECNVGSSRNTYESFIRK